MFWKRFCKISLWICIVLFLPSVFLQQVDSSTLNVEQGNQYFNSGQYKEALQEFYKEVSENTNSLEGYMGLAKSYLYLGYMEYADTSFENCIKVNQTPAIKVMIGEIYESKGYNKEALDFYKKALLQESTPTILGKVRTLEKKLGLPLSEDCSNWISTEKDKMDGTLLIGAKETIVISSDGGKTGFGIYIMKGSTGSLIITIQAVGAGRCIDEKNKINILFSDGSKLDFFNDGKFNCKGKATLYFGSVFGRLSQLKELKTKKIETMRVWTSDSFVQKDFTVDNQEEFYNVINCLTK